MKDGMREPDGIIELAYVSTDDDVEFSLGISVREDMQPDLEVIRSVLIGALQYCQDLASEGENKDEDLDVTQVH